MFPPPPSTGRGQSGFATKHWKEWFPLSTQQIGSQKADCCCSYEGSVPGNSQTEKSQPSKAETRRTKGRRKQCCFLRHAAFSSDNSPSPEGLHKDTTTALHKPTVLQQQQLAVPAVVNVWCIQGMLTSMLVCTFKKKLRKCISWIQFYFGRSWHLLYVKVLLQQSPIRISNQSATNCLLTSLTLSAINKTKVIWGLDCLNSISVFTYAHLCSVKYIYNKNWQS